MSKIVIRFATLDDIDEIQQVYSDAYRENRELGFPCSAETVEKMLLSLGLK